jgi:hypothetical protein
LLLCWVHFLNYFDRLSVWRFLAHCFLSVVEQLHKSSANLRLFLLAFSPEQKTPKKVEI